MSFILITLGLLVGTSVNAIPSFTRSYTSWQQLSPMYNISWTVNETSQEIYLGFQVQTTGWIGFGLAEPSSGSMPGADIMTANVTGSQAYVIDRFATAKALPALDTGCQDWQLVYGAEADGYTVIEVTRKLDTGDHVQDRVIPAGSIPIIWAYSPSNNDQFGFHSANHGTGFITFYGQTTPKISDLLMDPSITVAFPQITGFQIPAQQTTYICQSFELPIDQIRHIIAFEPVVNSTDPGMVHHGLVHGCAYESTFWAQYKTPGQCISPVGNSPSQCSDILLAWAHGGQATFLPDQAGFRVSNGSDGGFFRILLQMHYDNPRLSNVAIDYSGFRLYMTNQLRQHDAAVMTLGDPFTRSSPIPAGSTYTEYEYACSPTCTSTFNSPLNVFAEMPHMHELGQRIWTTRWRNGTQLPDAVRSEYFSWTFQQNIPVNYTIIPGDRLHTHCVYGNPTAQNVTFGNNSTQEMCMDFISYWPKQQNMWYCGAVPVGATNFSICGQHVDSNPNTRETNNPSRFGFDPANQSLRRFGTEIMDNSTCNIPTVINSSTAQTTGVTAGTATSTSTSSATSSGSPASSDQSSTGSSSASISNTSSSSTAGIGPAGMASNIAPLSSIMLMCGGLFFMTWFN